jgi:hypothetical protein
MMFTAKDDLQVGIQQYGSSNHVEVAILTRFRLDG